MIVRALDKDGDWTFGAGRNNYKRGLDACKQNIQTRLMSIQGDCFFATSDHIDWFNLLGGKEPQTSIAIDFALRATIVNTQNVVGIISSDISLDDEGILNPTYEVQTTFGAAVPQNGVLQIQAGRILDELGDILTTEDGTALGI